MEWLSTKRNFFIHETSLWFAIEVTGHTPAYEIVVLKRNVHALTNPDDYIRMEEFRKVHNGFTDALRALSTWIEKRIDQIEAQEMTPVGNARRGNRRLP